MKNEINTPLVGELLQVRELSFLRMAIYATAA